MWTNFIFRVSKLFTRLLIDISLLIAFKFKVISMQVLINSLNLNKTI